MKQIEGWNRDRRGVWCFAAVAVVLFFCLNRLTPYVADDYIYMYSFADRARLTSLGQLFESMYWHCFKMNGRLIAHALAQFFLMFPKWVFDAVNAAVLSGLLLGMYRLVNRGEKTNLLLLLGMSAAFWRYLPAFGQVMLWEVGAINYAWALVLGLVYLTPFVRFCLEGEPPAWKSWQKGLFLLFGVVFGSYTEVTSFIGIFLGILLLLAGRLLNGGKRAGRVRWLAGAVGTACVGYVILLLMPAELSAKAGGFSFGALLQNIVTVTELMERYQLTLLVVWVCAFLLGVGLEAEPRRLALSFLLFLGGVAANYMLIVADYAPERCLCTSTMLFILATGAVVPALLKTKRWETRLPALCLCGALCGMCLLSLVTGVYDIYETNRQFTHREAQIVAAREAGETEVTVALIEPATKYSVFWGTKFLDTEDNDTWPNRNMAFYYGIRILGR